jgi:multidrug efflux pump subunit AcrA (membrane-fusion protein)
METATQNVQAANAQVALAQARLDELRNPDDGQVSAARAARDAAQARYDAAEARHAALLQGASDAEIAAAKADLASAQASLQRLLDGPSESDVSIYETRVTQAETALQEARNALADATLAAPFAGTVTAVHVNPAEKSAGLAVQLIDAGALEVVLEINEIDLGRLAVGQAATVTPETWPNSPIASTVTAIAPSATTGNDGIVSYEVRLHLSDSDLPVRVGMTANADLVTARRENVLLVPNAAVTTDREAGTHAVTRISTAPDGARTETEVSVTIGLRNGQYTEITGGLEEGDRVLVRQLRAPTQQRFGPGQGPFSD